MASTTDNPLSKRNDFDSLIGLFLVHIGVEKGLSASTVHAYSSDLRRYTTWLAAQGIHDAQHIASSDVESFIASLHDESTRSIARRLASMHEFHRFLVSRGLVSADVSQGIKPPKADSHLPDVLSVDEVQRLLESTSFDGDTNEISLRDRALLEFLYATGARASEACSLNLEDLDLKSHYARLTGKGDKQRLVPVGSYARTALEKYINLARIVLQNKAKESRDRQAVFLNKRGKRLSRQSLWEIVENAGERAHIGKPLHPHTLRHSCATHLIQGGADVRAVQEMLGHSSVTTTQIYTHVSPQALIESYVMSHPRAR